MRLFTKVGQLSLIRTLDEFKHDMIIELEGKRIRIISVELINMLSEPG